MTVRTDGTRPGRPRDQRLDAAIATAALDLFVEGGLAAVAFDRLAARAGTSRSALYRRFRTREQVLLAALERLRAEGERGAEGWADMPLAEVLDAFEQRTVAALCDQRSMALLARLVGSGPEGARLRATYWQAVIAPRRAVFDRILIASGTADDAAAAALLQDQLSGALLHRALLDPTPLDPATARAYVHGLFQALGLRPRRQPHNAGKTER
jgi:AcrR family transcriptional regulator